METPKLIIFDCDGVLVDSEVIFNEVLSRNLSAHGLPISPVESMSLFVGGTMKTVKERAEEMGATLPDDWIDALYAQAFARLRQGVDMVNGIEDVLDALDAARIPYCVASNGSLEKMEITLGQTGLMKRFPNRIFSAYEVGIAKPDPGLFLHAATTLGHQPDSCVVIEDSVNGVMAAKRAKMKCFGYAEHGDGRKLAAEEAVVFGDMSLLPELLGIT